MRFNYAALAATTLFSVFVGALNAAGSQTTGVLEPGQAEAAVAATAPAVIPATWDHPTTEARGIWLTSGELLQPKEEILKKLDAIASANFNTIFVDTWFRGFVLYADSKIAMQYPEAMSHGQDVPSWIIDEAHKRHLRADSWPSYGFYAYHTRNMANDPSHGPLLDQHPELMAVDSSGKANLHNPILGDFYSFCPANPASHELLASIILESVTKYPFDGVNLDRMRFPSSEYCYCGWCREHFKQDTGIELTTFTKGSEGARKFLEWKREQNAHAVATVQRVIRKAHPHMPITAYVVGPAEKDDKAQSWDLWVKRGLVDAVGVSMYGPDIRDTTQRALQLLDGRKDKLICAISCDQKDPAYYLQNIQFARDATPMGQFTWYADKLQPSIAGLLAGPYAKPAEWPILP